MRNIRIFDEYSDYLATQEIVSGTGKYVEDIFPGFVYVRELAEKGIYAFYNGENSEEYEFGDVIYYDGTPKLKKVYYSAFTPSMGEKVGLVVVPTALSPDGNARIMAFGSITTEMQPSPTEPVANASKPESKDVLLGESMSYVKAFTQWHDNMADENQTVYTCVPGFYLDGGSSPKGNGDSVAKASVPGSEGKTSYYESPISLSNSSEMSHFSSDANFMYPNPHTNGEYYNTANTLVAISPFLGDSLKEQDPAYLQEELTGGSISPTPPSPIKAASPVLGATKDSVGGGNYNAFSDFSGYTWTYGCPPEYNGGGGIKETLDSASPSLKSSKPVSGVLGAYFPHDYVRQFYTDGTQQGDWYLPSMGEMGFVAARYKKIMEIFDYLYSVGALTEDGTDQIPGFGADANGAPIWTSTIGANGGGSVDINFSESTTFSASIPGDNTFPAISPVVVVISVNAEPSGGGSIIAAPRSNSGLLGAAVDTQNLKCDVQFVLNSSETEESTKALPGAIAFGNEVLPFAMIKKGEIQRTMGDYTVANGHQMKDFSQSGGGTR